MNIVFKIAIFTFLLNLAPGIILLAMPLDIQYETMLTPFDNAQGQQQFLEGLEGNVTLPSTTSGTMNIKDILLDAIFIGKILKFIDGVKTIIWGFAEMIYNVMLLFTPSTGVDAFFAFTTGIRTLLRTLISLTYGIGIFFLWTNRKINEN
jgi:hypothetical protein